MPGVLSEGKDDSGRIVGKQEVICYLRIARHAQGEILCDIDLSWGD
jgi:hypothetical protein